MAREWRCALAAALAGVCACSFELTGAGEGSSVDDGGTVGQSDSPTAGDAAGPGMSTQPGGATEGGTGDSTVDPGGTTGPTTESANGSSDDAEPTSTADDASSTGAGFDCASGASFQDLRTVSEAIAIDPPMSVDPAWGGLPGAPDVAWSGEPGAGAITFEVEVPCDRTYYLWGLTWDRVHGVNNCSGITNADAFMVAVDGGAEIQWSYGCQGCSNPDEVWTWTIVHAFEASGCVTSLWALDLAAGTHTIRFRNLDDGDLSPLEAPNVAAIAAMAISDDVAFTPMWP
jgi:hypothetical protein